MKTFISIIGISLIFLACQSDIIVPENLVGKWDPMYQRQDKTTDGNWGPWTTFNTLVALPTIEFTKDGRFLTDGKPGADCCYAGNKFTVSNNTILFSDTKSCPQMSCSNCSEWSIQRLESDTLVLESCNIRNKYARSK